jgi:hypothetical protein
VDSECEDDLAGVTFKSPLTQVRRAKVLNGHGMVHADEASHEKGSEGDLIEFSAPSVRGPRVVMNSTNTTTATPEKNAEAMLKIAVGKSTPGTGRKALSVRDANLRDEEDSGGEVAV